ncbi:MAG: TIGR00730 family Rossman fold protein [Actinomycetota bacterium]
MAALCVFCGSSTGFDDAYAKAMADVGRLIAEGGHRLVYGGGGVGLMKVVADAAVEAGGPVTGVMTEQLVALEVAHRGLSDLDVQPTMHARKARMAELSDGVIVAPGGFGTWEEAMEILTWNQLGLVSMPVVFLDTNGFYRPFFDQADAANAAGFVNDHNRSLAQRASTPAEAVELAAGPPPAYQAKWVN